ncbi:hypothetical protein Fcan01_17529 [Folsomia candida]|uniref:Uncharacterized protein n=1 Tax=Folsomia candida TaxID=158441 RepID=A0A226DQL3_FOLCA|nr:hypothetical protein Fcan01_17529 [Folsomia candida]
MNQSKFSRDLSSELVPYFPEAKKLNKTQDDMFLNDVQFLRRSRIIHKPSIDGLRDELTPNLLDFYCPERNPEFFDSPDVIKIGTDIFVKKHFVESKSQTMVCIKKINNYKDVSLDPSYINVSDYELHKFIGILDKLIGEIDSTPFYKLVPRLANSPESKIEEKNDQDFWSPKHTLEISNLKIRQFRNSAGTYSIKICCPKQTSQKWIGPSITLNIGVAKELSASLKNILDEIETEYERKLDNKIQKPTLEAGTASSDEEVYDETD